MDIDEDMTLSLNEFKQAASIVEKWSGPIEDVKASFDEIDNDNSGEIDFTEFCEWAIKKSFKALNAEDDEHEIDEESRIMQ